MLVCGGPGRGKHREKATDIRPDNDFSDMTPIAQVPSAERDMWDQSTLNSFRIAKESANKIKMQPVKLKKIFVGHISDKWVMSKIYKELL